MGQPKRNKPVMSRSNKVLTDIQDAYGHLISDYHNGQENVEVVEREDGFITTSRLGTS